MEDMVLRGTSAEDTAVSLYNVTKTYTQWQRTGKMKDIVKNLIKPEKKIITAIDNVSLEIKKGEFVAYAGANGAGKSTTIKILSGILQPTNGTVRVLGLNPASSRIELMKKIGIVFGQRTELWWDHPVETSFQWKKTVWDIPDFRYNKMFELITDLLDLGDLLKTFARELSLGQRMRADLGLMLLHEPELIFLDEPTLGLDVLAKKQMIDFLKTINRENKTTVVVTSHDMNDLEVMAERIILMSKGHLEFDGSFDLLRKLNGSMCKIILTTVNTSALEINCLRLISSHENIHEYEFDIGKISLRRVLSEISNSDEIMDIEIKKPSLEEIIQGLYTKWKTPGNGICTLKA